jgi:serine O-acetyltransferase
MKSDNFIQYHKEESDIKQFKVPVIQDVHNFISEITSCLFPVLSNNRNRNQGQGLQQILFSLNQILKSYETGLTSIDQTLEDFKKSIPELYALLNLDAKAIYEGDPASESVEEVIICYPGFYAILVYRIAHELFLLGIPVLPRMLTEFSHSKTGIDIHPGAKIGRSFFIDHGTGVVIGETAEIGNDVKIYQGVTIGALSVSKMNAGTKRHPTIEDNTVIYAGTTILGGDTVIGHDSTIGGNVWLTQSIEPYSTVINQVKIHMKNKNPNIAQAINFVI